MKHAIANPDSNVTANLFKQVTANSVKHMIANPDSNVFANPVKQVTANSVKHMIANPVNNFLKFALLEKLSVFIFFLHTYIYWEKTEYCNSNKIVAYCK